MANPQTENGYVRIVNECVEALARFNLSPQESRVLWVVFRKTYGFNKKIDRIPLSQFAKMTGMDRRNAHRALKKLSSKQMIVIQTDDRGNVSYGFQKDYEKWITVSSKQMIVIQTDDSLSPKRVTKVSPKQTPSKDKKENSKNNTAFPENAVGGNDSLYLSKKKKKLTGWKLETFESFWTAFNYKKGRAEAADSWLDIQNLDESLLQKILEAAKREAAARPELTAKGKTPKMAQGWLSGRRWEDEPAKETSQPEETLPWI